MDTYIYFRALDYLSQYRIATKSELVRYAGNSWANNPVEFLYINGFIEITKGSYKGATYYQLTDKGKKLHLHMKSFYENYYDALIIVNKKLKRKKIMRREGDLNVF